MEPRVLIFPFCFSSISMYLFIIWYIYGFFLFGLFAGTSLPFLEQYPARIKEFRALVKNGNLTGLFNSFGVC